MSTFRTFIEAVQSGNSERVQPLLKDPDLLINEPDSLDKHGDTALIMAIKANNLPIVELLLSQPRIDVNMYSYEGFSALHAALAIDSSPIVNLLLSHPNFILKNHYIPFLHVQSVPMTELLLAQPGINLEDALTSAIISKVDNPHIVERLLREPGIDVPRNILIKTITQILKYGEFSATYPKFVSIVKLLLENPAVDINYQTDNKDSALSIALELENSQIVEELLLKGPILKTHIIKDGMTLLESLARKCASTTDLDKKKRLKSLIEFLCNKAKEDAFAEARKDPEVWRGYDGADESFFRNIFSEELIEGTTMTLAMNTSLCPFCLTQVYRPDACMYMTHEGCAGIDPVLNETYKLHDGSVHWCTLCGRPCKAHAHYKINNVFGPLPPSHSQKHGHEVFQNDCKHVGGGGHLEKVARFNAFWEEAVALQTLIGVIPNKEAKLRLVQAYWNGPFKKGSEAEINALVAAKGWAPTTVFSDNNKSPEQIVAVASANAAAKNAAYREAGRLNLPYNDESGLPRFHPRGDNVTSLEEVEFLVEFCHKKQDGTRADHSRQKIGLETIFSRLQDYVDNDARGDFGYCLTSSKVQECGLVHPKEILHILKHTDPSTPAPPLPEGVFVPPLLSKADHDRYTEIYNAYKAHYNLIFAPKRGGLRKTLRKQKQTQKQKKRQVRRTRRV